MNFYKQPVILRIGIPALIAVITVGWMARIDFRGAALLWTNLYWIVCAATALAISLLELPDRRGANRTVRLILSASLATYLMGQLTWGVQVYFDWNVVPGPSDVLFLLAPIPTLAATVIAIRHRVSQVVETTAILDGITVQLATVAVIVAIYAPGLMSLDFLERTTLLLYPILYMAPVGAFLVTALAAREKIRISGNLLMLLGALILGGSFVFWTSAALDGQQPVATIVDFLFGVGLLLIGLGAATFDNIPDATRIRRQSLKMMSSVLPLIAIVATVLVVMMADLPKEIAPVCWIAVVAMLAVNGLRQNLLIKAHRNAKIRLQALAAELSGAEETERRKIATYLHDKVGQSIAVMSLKFGEIREASESSATVDLLDDVDSLLSGAADDIQTSTFDLSPPTLYELGLVPSIRSLAAAYTKKFAVDIEVDCTEIPSNIPVEHKPLLYRFVRELVINAIKHANATKIIISIRQMAQTTAIDVADDGVGFNPAAHDAENLHSFGLYSIRERCRAIGGRFVIQSARGQGTRASIILPIEELPGVDEMRQRPA